MSRKSFNKERIPSVADIISDPGHMAFLADVLANGRGGNHEVFSPAKVAASLSDAQVFNPLDCAKMCGLSYHGSFLRGVSLLDKAQNAPALISDNGLMSLEAVRDRNPAALLESVGRRSVNDGAAYGFVLVPSDLGKAIEAEAASRAESRRAGCVNGESPDVEFQNAPDSAGRSEKTGGRGV